MYKNVNGEIVVRFAPSPTGFLTLGNYRTALFCYLFAKQKNGKYILRIEDTDKERSKKEYEDDIISSFEWLGLTYDQFYRQSDRIEIYKKYLNEMVEKGFAYIAEEQKAPTLTVEVPTSPSVRKGQRSEVIRFKNPNKKITFHDIIRGEVTFDTTDLHDFVIAKSLDEPLYHLAVVIDDHEMDVTHIIRGEDHISNTPRQILIQEAIGAKLLQYAHLPLILASDRSKLSKRNGGSSVRECREKGYLPEAVVNFLGLLGFNPGGKRELYTLDELVKVFDLSRVQKSGAIFNAEKLNWMNKEYIKKLPPKIQRENILKRLKESMENLYDISYKMKNNKFAEKICEIVLDRIEKWSDVDELVMAGELDYFFKSPEYPKEMLFWKKDLSKDLTLKSNLPRVDLGELEEETKKHLMKILEIFSDANEKVFENSESVKNLIWNYAEKEGRGSVLWPLRVALSGREKSPDPFTLVSVIGKSETIIRLQKAIEIL